jgi:ubiquinone/menaquinone biosynthesis C-methylase UbiE
MKTISVLSRGLAVIRDLEPQFILDLGCGTGRDTGALADLPGVRVVAVDVDANALSKAPQRDNVLRVRADATRLPLAAGATDAAYSFGLAQVLGVGSDARVHRLMEELQRVVRPGGAAIMGTLADFGRTDGPDRSLTGADISKAMRGALVLRELIGLMDLDRSGRIARHWYISATPAPNLRPERRPHRKRRRS